MERAYPVKIKTAEFVRSAPKAADFPGDRPSAAFLGRSNVGKSSLINKLTNRRVLAKTSSAPGKTRLINFFDINGEFYFVDLPGLGYAKVSASEREALERMVLEFMSDPRGVKLICHLVDIRHDPTAVDIWLAAALRETGTPVAVVFTKADKVTRGKGIGQVAKLMRGLGYLNEPHVLFSKLSGQGKSELLEIIGTSLRS